MLISDQKIKQGRFTITKANNGSESDSNYEAFDNELNRTIILKVISRGLNKITTSKQIEAEQTAFADKAKIIAEIKHQSLLRIEGYFSEINQHYLVLEKSDGETLSDFIKKIKDPVSFSDLTNWTEQLLDVLDHLHRQIPPIFHGDINPQNIQIDSTGQIKLCIHNLIWQSVVQKNRASENEQFDSITLAFSPLEKIWEDLDFASQKVIFNTFDEQAQKELEKTLDAPSDIYSLGATLYYLTTGQLPIDALTRRIDMVEGKNDPLADPAQLNPDIPQRFSNLLMKALEITRKDRFDSAKTMLQALQNALAIEYELQTPVIARAEKVVPEIPPAQPKAEAEKQFISELEVSQNEQIELIRKQLQRAEEKRLAAEKRAAEAERLLQEKRKENTEQKEILTNMVESSQSSQPETPPDLYDGADEASAGSESKKKPLFKIAAGAFALLIIGGAAFAVFNFSDVFSTKPLQTVSTDKLVPPVATSEMTPLPVPEIVENSIDSTDETSENDSAPDAQSAILPNTDKTPAADAVANDLPPEKAIRKPIVRSQKINRNIAKPKPSQPTPPATQKPKPPKPRKKSVTLDDLLKDN